MSYITHYHQIKQRSLRGFLRHAAISFLSFRASSNTPGQKRVTFSCFHSYFPDLEDNFRQQIEFLSQHFIIIPYSQGVEKILRGNIDGNYLCISADDGYKNFMNACRIFDDYGIKAMVFANPAFIEEKDFAKLESYSRTRLSHPPIEFMDWHDVDNLLSRGHEVGNHTYSHFDLGKCQPQDLHEELGRAYEVLKAHVGPRLHFAWPYGLHENITSEALRVVYDLGHLSAASCMRGHHSEPLKLDADTPSFLWRHQIEPFDPLAHLRYFLLK